MSEEALLDGSSTVEKDDKNVKPAKKSVPKMIGLTILFVFLILFFTLLKLPQVRITSLLQAYVQVALDPYGIYVTDQGRELSILRGFRYTLDHPTLEFADQTRVELDSLVVTPSFLPLLRGKLGVNMTLRQGASSIVLVGAGRKDLIDAKLDLDHVDIGKLGVFAYLGSLKGSGEVSGTFQIAGTLSTPASLAGLINLKIRNLKLDEQNLMGFQLPPLVVSEGTVAADIRDGKILIKTVQLGKGSDDLVLSLKGDVTLNRFLNSSALNLQTSFGLSDRVKQSLSLLDTLLGNAKTTDGRYAYKLTGTLGSPYPVPDPNGGK